MTNLYDDLAELYEAMYLTFINYEEEFLFYHNLLEKYKKRKLLEIGCGTGNLALRFLKHNYPYFGLDVSDKMLDLAKAKVPKGQFLQADMRNFHLPQPVGSIIITGRTISYLVSNRDLSDTFASLHQNLLSEGIVIFDFIDANRFIPSITPSKAIIHKAVFKKTEYQRESLWSWDLEQGFKFNWQSTFYKKENDSLEKIGYDEANPRTFTCDEIRLFLHLNGFEVLEVIDRASYAFPTFVIVAKRK